MLGATVAIDHYNYAREPITQLVLSIILVAIIFPISICLKAFLYSYYHQDLKAIAVHGMVAEETLGKRGRELTNYDINQLVTNRT